MREISIYIPETLTDPDKHFQDNMTKNSIKCGHDLTKKCTPNCAACEISQEAMYTTATCLRGSFTIGKVV